ncbi:MAG: hypothetical protein OXG78_01315 [Chloroflexi bacterium]|nr:hypothetical protein [Chloroflexota bacterium]
MTIQYSIAVDGDRDGTAENEISGQVIEMRWRLGMRRAYDSMAEMSWARITVNNPTGAFSPERNLLTSGTRIRIQSIVDGVARTHFTGTVSHVEPDEGEWSRKLALIHLHDMQVWLESSPARLPPQIDVTAEEVIEALLAQAVIVPAVIAGYCLINVAGFNRIDSVSLFPPLRPEMRLQAGKTRFAYVGDWWRESTSIRAAIGDIVASERGRFFIDRRGAAVFLNRHHTLVHETLAAEFDDDMSGMAYSYGDQRLNKLTLQMYPRAIGASDTLLWQLPAAMRIEPRSELELTLPLRDERGEPIGLLQVDALDSRFMSAETGGVEISRDAWAEIARSGSSSAAVRIRNRMRQAVYLTRLRLFGKPLYRGDPLEIVVADGEGIYRYGIRQLSLDLPALSDIATAQAFAEYEVARRKHPRGRVGALSTNARERPTAALKAGLFDRIRISEAQTGHSGQDYFIIGEEHHVAAAGKRHTVTWTMEPADSTRFVIVNDSVIGDSSEVLAPY